MVQDADPGRDPRHLTEQVAGQQDGHPVVPGQVGEHGADLHDTGGVQAVDRFVQHQDPGLVQQGLGQPEALGVAQRQRACLRPDVGPEPEPVHRVVDHARATGAGAAAGPRRGSRAPSGRGTPTGSRPGSPPRPTPNGRSPGARPARASRRWGEPCPAASGSAWSCPRRSGPAARTPLPRRPPGTPGSPRPGFRTAWSRHARSSPGRSPACAPAQVTQGREGVVDQRRQIAAAGRPTAPPPPKPLRHRRPRSPRSRGRRHPRRFAVPARAAGASPGWRSAPWPGCATQAPTGSTPSVAEWPPRPRRRPRQGPRRTRDGQPPQVVRRTGRATTAAAMTGSYPSCRTMSSLVGKYRNSVAGETSAAAAICSQVVAAYPRLGDQPQGGALDRRARLLLLALSQTAHSHSPRVSLN